MANELTKEQKEQLEQQRRAMPFVLGDVETPHLVGEIDDGRHCCRLAGCTPWERDDTNQLVVNAETAEPISRWWCGCNPPPPPDAP